MGTTGYRSKSVTTGLDCCLGYTTSLSITTAPARRHMRQLCRYVNEPYTFTYRMAPRFV